MLGKSGQIVCTLKIQNGYPATAGHICVEEIQGADRSILFSDVSFHQDLVFEVNLRIETYINFLFNNASVNVVTNLCTTNYLALHQTKQLGLRFQLCRTGCMLN